MKIKLRMTVSRKLTISFLSIIVVLMTNGVFAFMSSMKMNEQTEEITNRWLVNIEKIHRVNYLSEYLLTQQLRVAAAVDPAKQKALLAEGDQIIIAIDQQLKAYMANRSPDDDNRLLQVMDGEFKTYVAVYRRVMLEAVKPNNSVKVAALMEESEGSFDKLQSYTDNVISLNREGADKAKKKSEQLYKSSNTLIISGIGLSLLIVSGLIWYLNRLISSPIRKTAAVLTEIATGNLNVTTPAISNRDEIGEMVKASEHMLSKLRTTIESVQNASTNITASAEEMMAVSEQNRSSSKYAVDSFSEVAAGSEEQLHSFEEISRASVEMAIGVQRIAETSSLVSEMSAEASDRAKAGGVSIQRVVNKMMSIDEAVREAAEQVQQLEQHTQTISVVSDLIGSISKQTNLLALNAAIEAARAGEHGRGFAVVAEEVRKLSTQSAESVTTISELIVKIRKDAVMTVHAMRISEGETREGLASIQEAGHSFELISETSLQVLDKIQEVAAASEQLAASSEEVASSISQITDIARRTSDIARAVSTSAEEQYASAEEIASSASGLSGIALEMNDVVQRFKL